MLGRRGSGPFWNSSTSKGDPAGPSGTTRRDRIVRGVRTGVPRAVSIAACCCCLGSAWVGVARSQYTVGTSFNLGAGTAPSRGVIADVNNDGAPDIVMPNYTAGTVSVWLGNGHGAFATRVDYATASNPTTAAVGDLNGDGLPDLAVANYGANSVSVFFNNGNGTFAPKVDFTTDSNPWTVAVADLNGDGRLDLVTANYGPNSVSVLLGDGVGGFAPHVEYPAGNGSIAMDVGDVTGDGVLDLVVSNYVASSVSIFPGDGHGGLGTRTDFATGLNPWSVAIGDVDADGIPDLVTANTGANTVSVLKGGASYASHSDFPTGATPIQAAIGDLDGDGKPDIAVTNRDGNSVSVLLGDGAGSFGPKTDFGTGAGAFSVMIRDLNGDGRRDLVVANSTANTVSVLLRTGYPLLAPRTEYATAANPTYVAAADLNGDGNLDLVTANSGSSVSVLLGNGSGSFTTRTDFATGGLPNSVAIGDLNSDGKLDLATANQLGTVSVLPGNGAGSFGPNVDYPTGNTCSSVAVERFNNGPRFDIVTANKGANNVSVLLQGSSGFGFDSTFATGTSPVSVAAGLLNPQDGLPDIVAANQTDNTVSVVLRVVTLFGALTWAPKVDYPVAANPNAVTTAFLRRLASGQPIYSYQDIVTANQANTVSVLLANDNTNGGYGPRQDYPTSGSPQSVAVADMNGDGIPDIVTVGSNASILLGDNTGAFAAPQTFALGGGGLSVAIGDLNDDGVPDLVTQYGGSNGVVAVLLGYVRSKLALSASSTIVAPGSSLTLTATLAALPETPSLSPPKAIRFYDGLTPLGSALINWTYQYGTPGTWTGTASITFAANRLGTRSYTATYDGEGLRMSSISPPVLVNVGTPAPLAIRSVTDVGGDQGKQVRVTFLRSGYDVAGSSTAITQYEVYRQINPSFAPSLVLAASRGAGLALRPASVQLSGWDYVGAVAAHADSVYSIVAPTVVDSNATGIHRTTFFVRAATASPLTYFDSPPDSGYSVDNIAPAAPNPFTAAYAGGATHLHWGANGEADFWGYRLYRGSSSSFTPGPGSLLATQSDTGYVDIGPAGSYYKLSAVDVDGNESAYSLLTPSGTTDVGGAGASRTVFLAPPSPNPARGNITLRFGMPHEGAVSLRIYDVHGREVGDLAEGQFAAGEHTITWRAPKHLNAAPFGVLFACLRADGVMRTERFVLMR